MFYKCSFFVCQFKKSTICTISPLVLGDEQGGIIKRQFDFISTECSELSCCENGFTYCLVPSLKCKRSHVVFSCEFEVLMSSDNIAFLVVSFSCSLSAFF